MGNPKKDMREKKRNSFVIQNMMPDGPHWFMGVAINPATEKTDHPIAMNLWSPYKRDIKVMTESEARMYLRDVLNAGNVECGGVVMPYEKASIAFAWHEPEEKGPALNMLTGNANDIRQNFSEMATRGNNVSVTRD